VTAASHPGATVAVTGARGALGRRVIAALERRGASALAVDPIGDELKERLTGVDAVAHLSFAVGPELGDDEAAALNVERTTRVLDAAGALGISHVVLSSSAAVYGAWQNNPVPLTEDAPVRPNPGFAFAAQKAELERLALEWGLDHPDASVCILRPAVPLGEDDAGFLASALAVRAPVATGEAEVPMQFVHVDDLAEAVAHACVERLDGVFNVSADGWLTASAARALAGAPPRVRVPSWLLARVQGWAWRWRLSRIPPGVQPYTLHPWVVANDRLEATGWSPSRSNEEAVVETTDGMPWSRLSPKRKQELALGISVAAIAGAALGTVAVVRRVRRRRRA
jgi:nucleoside-diphosphate-sugar epimerase